MRKQASRVGEQLAEHIHQPHLLNRAAVRVRDAGVTHDDGESLGPGDGHVDAVAIQDKTETTASVFSGARTERENDEKKFLTLPVFGLHCPFLGYIVL